MKKIGIFYGSTTGNSETVANKLQIVFTKKNADVINVSEATQEDIEKYDNLILGCSTWGIGELQDDFEGFIDILEKAELSGKKIAIFGTGDQYSFSDSFVDSIGTIYECIQNKGCDIIGKIPTDEYDFNQSKAEVNGVFVGLPIDEDNQSDQTDEKIKSWTTLLTLLFR